MKKYLIVTTTAFVCFLQACKEVGPDINLHGNQNAVSDTTYVETPIAAPETKNTVVEEFTGVRCTNCPQGHAIIEQLHAQYGDRVVAIAFHPTNSLGNPYPVISTQNFENAGSDALYTYLGNQGIEPSAAVDRQLFTGLGQTYILMDKSVWGNAVAQQLATTTPVNVILSSTYNASTRQVTVVTELHYTQNVTEANDLTIALTEDSIVSAQLDGAVIDTFYVHNGVFRDFITTGSNGSDAINQTLEAGRVIRNVYQYTLDALWNPAHMNIIAFVHEDSQNSKNVYQAKKVKVE
ncbi:MAG TPA: Omp28 family outer membrane lipoprotein [Chitinophagales bacterium]|nr:Omp28 family outer membrane lipoprotein [Chitinophagales bacterium]